MLRLGEFQSDRLEGEFGIYPKEAGGNYYISVEEVINGLRIQRIKLFDKLNFEASDEHYQDACCTEDLTDEEKELMDLCYEGASKLDEDERAKLFHIAGYVTFKERKGSDKESLQELPCGTKDSEFTELVSRGKLSFPSRDIFNLSLYCFAYFKSLPRKNCATKLLKAFHEIYESSLLEIDNINSVTRRFANTFFKGEVNKVTDKLKAGKKNKNKSQTSQVKFRRMTGK